MFICSLAVLFLALQNSSGARIVYSSDVPGCSPVGYVARKTFLEEHNKRRSLLAKGDVKIEGEDMPSAANMLFMGYDCKLEAEANKVTETTCEANSNGPEFNETKTNFALIKSHKDNGEISAPREAVSQWWDKSSEWHDPQKLTMNDKSAIPFFLIAQAEGNKVGCSVRSCKEAGLGASYYSVACVYEKGVEAGRNLYEQGEAGSKCTEIVGYEIKEALCKEKKKRAD